MPINGRETIVQPNSLRRKLLYLNELRLLVRTYRSYSYRFLVHCLKVALSQLVTELQALGIIGTS